MQINDTYYLANANMAGDAQFTWRGRSGIMRDAVRQVAINRPGLASFATINKAK